MAGEKLPNTSAAAAKRQVVAALSSAPRHGVVRAAAPAGAKQLRPAAAPSGDAAAARRAAAAAAVAMFNRKHGEFRAAAGGVAYEFGADVTTVVFAPGWARAAHHQYLGGRAAAAALLGKDVSVMGLKEAKAHQARLLALRAAVARKLQEKTADGTGRPNKIRRLEQ